MAEDARDSPGRGSPSHHHLGAGSRIPPQPHPRPSRHRRVPPPPAAPEEEEDAGELPPSPPRHSPPPPAPEPRLSQLFDRLSHLTELSHSLTHSPPASPRLLPRRPRAQPPSPPSGSYDEPVPPPRPPSAQQRLLADLELLEAAGAADATSPALLLAYWAASGRLPPPSPAPSGGVDWQQRCVQLELELHQFRVQAGRVRDLLRDKVSTLFVTSSCKVFTFRPI